jgi:ABC-type Fe3+/spermidine/putrescine transport system ATPase subunit
MQVELKSLQREVGVSFVFVTHDQEEAMVMSDRIALLRMGELEQVASPREIYSHPATAYTAQFIGHTNLLRGEIRGGIARCESLSWTVGLPEGQALFSLRPENIRIVDPTISRSNSGVVSLRGKIQRQAFHGATELLQIVCGDELTLSVRTATRENRQGDLHLEFSPADAVPVRESPERG